MSKLFEFRGVRYLPRELSEMSGVEIDTLLKRIRVGWTVEQAMTTPSLKQRRAGVVMNFAPSQGTGAGSTAQEIPEITFSEQAENT